MCLATRRLIYMYETYDCLAPQTCNTEIWRKWNEWGFRSPLCTYRINWVRRTFWGWWNEWDDTALQTQDSKFEHWRSEVKHGTFRSRRLPTILNVYEWAGKKTFFSNSGPEWGSNLRFPPFQASSFNHCTRASALRNLQVIGDIYNSLAPGVLIIETCAWYSSHQGVNIWDIILITWPLEDYTCERDTLAFS